ncbi:hypothetical protein pclt_cds_886 [Pandoravirus celtis]|uniref:Glycine-rich domain-containing protein n=1 Tax=Pandoravirus celtis TaxID=2568002 RepID=A0A4D6EJI8_9VIRU|nr:hypothetical protein pclt_cds_886 [Pandoravirus celtis]
MQRATTIKSGRRPSIGAVLVTAVALVALCLVAVPPVASLYHYTVFVPTSRTWSAPASATNVTITLWGGGGASAVNIRCGAGGGSGAAIIGRSTGSDAWSLPIQEVQWAITVGQGGAPRDAGAYDPSILAARRATAARRPSWPWDPTALNCFARRPMAAAVPRSLIPTSPCVPGRWRRRSGIVGRRPVPGGGTPMGGVDNNPVGPPTEGAMVGDVKAGGAGAGYGSVGGDFVQPFNQGAGWTSPGRSWGGGSGWLTSACYGWGGAAGFNGNGGNAVFNDVTVRRSTAVRAPARPSRAQTGLSTKKATSRVPPAVSSLNTTIRRRPRPRPRPRPRSLRRSLRRGRPLRRGPRRYRLRRRRNHSRS